MSLKLQSGAEARQSPRIRLPAMYTLLRLRKKGEARYNQTGYIYDISQTGMRFELDDPIEPGTELEFRALLPVGQTTTFSAQGHLIRMHDDLHEVGPVRMAMHFDSFKSNMDKQKLAEYLDRKTPRLAQAA